MLFFLFVSLFFFIFSLFKLFKFFFIHSLILVFLHALTGCVSSMPVVLIASDLVLWISGSGWLYDAWKPTGWFMTAFVCLLILMLHICAFRLLLQDLHYSTSSKVHTKPEKSPTTQIPCVSALLISFLLTGSFKKKKRHSV